METNGVIVTKQPGGIWTACGGTRTEVKLSRPWQSRINIDPKKCPFENEKLEAQRIVEIYGVGNWIRIKNSATPFVAYHELIIPRTCWEENRLRTLGGPNSIANALAIAGEAINESEEEKFIVSVHVEYLAGQNQGHPHYHLLSPRFTVNGAPLRFGNQAETEVRERARTDEHLRIFNVGSLMVFAGGLRAGQCFIVPEKPAEMDRIVAGTLARMLSRVIDLYAERFFSEEGLPPDYMIGLMFREKKFRYGFYLPILNHWGATEYFALLGEEPVILPWPHEETVRHLKGDAT